MRRPRRRSVINVLLACVAVGAISAFAGVGTASAAPTDEVIAGTTTPPPGKATATLQIIEPSVSVKRAGKVNFKPGKEGQRLRVGDTVQTDATGFAQVNYTDDSFTRLDVNTTFTIVSLTDDEGNRQIKGSVDTGQTWNRTSALTESESFEQEGAGATAAVTGTAFLVSCTSPTTCTFTSVVDGITLTTVDGEIQHLDPLMECDSDEVVVDEDADLCGAPAQVTLDAILANAFIIENLYIDGVNGYQGIVVVDDAPDDGGDPVVTATPTIPGAPTGVSAVAGDGQATVSFAAPSASGGSAITGYTVTSSPGGFSCSTAALSCVVSGLTNGTSYTFTVHATNAVGDGPESGASSAVTPATVPGPPTKVMGTRGNHDVSVAFDAPLSNGGSAITGYTVTSSPGGFTGSGAGSPIVVSGLTNGTSYTFTVHATNAVGDGPESSASDAVTPATVPGAPTNVVGTRGNDEVSVAFDAPLSNGGSAITGYTVTSSPGGFTGSGAGSPIVVSGLTNGTSYTFTVHATNAVGDGSESSASAGVTPAAVPDAPTGVSAVAGDANATVSFSAPSSNGSAITSYTVTSSPGGFTGSGSASPIVVSGLTNGTSYTFTVHATNAVGNSTESDASSAVTPATVPDAPTGVSADAGDGQATVSFSAPSSDGGSAITGYTVTSSPGGFSASGSASPIVVSGLTNGTSYTFTVHASNTVGTSAESSASSEVTPSEPEVIAFDGSVLTASPPGTLGGYAMTAFGDDSRPNGSAVSSVGAPGGGSVGFSTALTHTEVGVGWATWSNGYTGDVYVVPNSSPVTLTMPANTLAFYFYAEPNSFSVFTVTATASGGTTSGPVNVNGNSGATYFGFSAPSADNPITSIDVSTSDPSGMAIGEFGINQAP